MFIFQIYSDKNYQKIRGCFFLSDKNKIFSVFGGLGDVKMIGELPISSKPLFPTTDICRLLEGLVCLINFKSFLLLNLLLLRYLLACDFTLERSHPN